MATNLSERKGRSGKRNRQCRTETQTRICLGEFVCLALGGFPGTGGAQYSINSVKRKMELLLHGHLTKDRSTTKAALIGNTDKTQFQNKDTTDQQLSLASNLSLVHDVAC
ncbi:MAG TPA: hypothetical protein VFS76_08725 [Pyrinomonadaceae bacterium]|nr:hypothetical protein [Pyrinomonadaceae bacterium]